METVNDFRIAALADLLGCLRIAQRTVYAGSHMVPPDDLAATIAWLERYERALRAPIAKGIYAEGREFTLISNDGRRAAGRAGQVDHDAMGAAAGLESYRGARAARPGGVARMEWPPSVAPDPFPDPVEEAMRKADRRLYAYLAGLAVLVLAIGAWARFA